MSNPAKSLGRLERVGVRDVWQTEANDFTPWLAQEENITILSDAIGIELEVEAQEKEVGPFRADILCKDTATANWVLIENQLEKTDHTHLGQLMTYAAGLHAVTIVWIAERFTEEHRAALDWLNEITDDRFNFFGLEIELWRIGDSPIAPKFNVVCKPNDWSKTVANAASSLATEELTQTKKLQLEYWTSLRDYIDEQGSSIRCQKPLPQYWTNFAIGRAGFWIEAFANTRDKRIGLSLVLDGPLAGKRLDTLQQAREEIESAVGQPLDWTNDPEKKQRRIYLRSPDTDPMIRDDWPNQHKWLLEKIELFRKVFGTRVKTLDEGDEAPQIAVTEN